MNEPPGLPSALGIEAVEWLDEGAENLTVRVSGRWRRRRPSWSGQPLLVIEVSGTRHRYPAMPEPPSLTGAAPGTWQMSFAVPAPVAGQTGARVWLQLGSVMVPLPVRVQAADPIPAPDEEILALRRIRAAELAAEAAARRATEADEQATALQARIDALERELERVGELAAERARAGRAAEQRAHAERALRQELEDRLGRLEDADEEEAEDERTAELEREVEGLRRAVDEAEHVAQAAVATRRRAEERLAELTARARSSPTPRSLRTEFQLARATEPAPAGERDHPSPSSGDEQRLRRERHLSEARATAGQLAETVTALRRELEARTRSEAQLRGTIAALQAPPVADIDAEALHATLAELRSELGHLRSALEAETAAREQAEQRVARAYDAIGELRDELEHIRSGRVSDRPAEPAGAVEAERLTAAMTRLRESAPAQGEERARPTSEWLARALRALARSNPASATRVLSAMLPASEQEARVATRLLSGGRLRRRLRNRAARIRGRGAVPKLLDELLREPVRLDELRIDPQSAMTLVGAMIDPEWSRGKRFTVAYNSGPYLHVRGIDRALVSEAALGPVDTTIVCGLELVAAVLGGERPAGTVIVGDQRPLELIEEWLERAQSD